MRRSPRLRPGIVVVDGRFGDERRALTNLSTPWPIAQTMASAPNHTGNRPKIITKWPAVPTTFGPTKETLRLRSTDLIGH